MSRLGCWVDARYLIALLVVAVPSVTLTVLAARHDTFPADRSVLLWVQDLEWYRPIAWLFNEWPARALVIIGWSASALWLLYTRRFSLGAAFVLAGAIRPSHGLIKAAVDRPRPSGDFPIRDAVADASFPSGHVTTAAVFCLLWFVVAPQVLPPRLALAARAAAVLFVALTALSRMWAGVHWLSDTYGAVLWSLLLVFLVMAIGPALSRAGLALARLSQRGGERRSRPEGGAPPI